MSNASSDDKGLNIPGVTPEPPAGPAGGHRVRRHGLPHPALALAVLLAIFLGSQIIASLVVGSFSRSIGSAVAVQFLFVFGAEGLALAVLAKYMQFRHIRWSDIGFTRPAVRDVWMAVVALFVYFAVYALLLQTVRMLVPGFDAGQKQDVGFDGAGGVSLVMVFLALVVAAPVAEETMLRGFFFTSLRKRYTYLVSAVVTSLVFAALHLGGGVSGEGLLWVAALDTFVLSLALCYLRQKTGRIWASILLHAAKNAIAFSLLFLVK